MLGMAAPKLRAYSRETVVAEKLEAIVKLGMLNSRFKDYFDLHYLAQKFPFDGALLVKSIAGTFARRGTAFPAGLPARLDANVWNRPGENSRLAGVLAKDRAKGRSPDTRSRHSIVGRISGTSAGRGGKRKDLFKRLGNQIAGRSEALETGALMACAGIHPPHFSTGVYTGHRRGSPSNSALTTSRTSPTKEAESPALIFTFTGIHRTFETCPFVPGSSAAISLTIFAVA
jgi:hypothetical protein